MQEVRRSRMSVPSPPTPAMRSRGWLWAWLAVAGIVLVGIGLVLLRMQPLPLDDDDFAGLIRSAELGFPAKPEDEVMQKRRTLNGAIKVHYRAGSLGTRQLSSIDEITMTYSSSTQAALGFEAMKIGGSSAFALAAGKGQTMTAREIRYDWADRTYWADYRVGETAVGAFVIVQTANVVHFVSLNGLTVNADRLEPILRAHWKPRP